MGRPQNKAELTSNGFLAVEPAKKLKKMDLSDIELSIKGLRNSGTRRSAIYAASIESKGEFILALEGV